MTTIDSNYTFHLDMTPIANKFKGEDKNIDFSIVVRNAENKIVASNYHTLPEGVLVIAAHPEAKDEDFVRYGKAIKDAFERFLRHDLIEQMGYKEAAKEITAKNTGNMELRVFDKLWDVFRTRKTLNEMREFIISVCKEFNLDSNAVKKEISRANKALVTNLNKLA